MRHVHLLNSNINTMWVYTIRQEDKVRTAECNLFSCFHVLECENVQVQGPVIEAVERTTHTYRLGACRQSMT